VPGKKKPKKTDKKAAYLGYEHEKEAPPTKRIAPPPVREGSPTGVQIPPEPAPPAPVPTPNENQPPAASTQRNWMKPRIQERRWTR
jgi:penicillin-binding protein 1A